MAAAAVVVACSRGTPEPVTRPRPLPPPAAEPVVPPPPPAEAAEPLPQEPPAAPAVPPPLMVRVGLATDLPAVTLPCCDAAVAVDLGGERWPLTAPLRVEPAAEVTQHAVYRLQVAALKDEHQAAGLAERLAAATGEGTDTVFDAGNDLYRVRHGRYPTREAAEAGRRRLEGLGITDSWVVSDGGSPEPAALAVRRGAEGRTVAGRWLSVSAPPEGGITLDGGRYRGRLLVYLNDRGLLNLVNELPVEAYLRGVVPMEMGPELYPRLEALKAQAVAARTFTVRNLGEFAGEGYDICSTPRCQVYGGMAVEHPLADRAIAETAGEIAVYAGQPAETFYSATCGGHTENVEVVFPLKRGPYLRGVPCLEAGSTRLAGSLPAGVPFPEGLTRALLPPTPGDAVRSLAGRLEQLALLAGLAVPKDHLRSLDPEEVRRFLLSVFDLAVDPRLLAPAAELAPLVAAPPDAWHERDRRLARFLSESDPLGRGPGELRPPQVEDLLFHLATYLGVLRSERVRFLSLTDGTLRLKDGAAFLSAALGEELVTFRRVGESLESGPLELMAGDLLDLYWLRDRLVGAALVIDPAPVPRLPGRPRTPWAELRSDDQLAAAVAARYPGFPFTGFEIVSRGVSGRVGKLRLMGRGGRTLMVEGLAVRWTLDLPDTLFTAERRDGGYRFAGRGWGHGVGMCQAGAFGMAARGYGYRDILDHYYTGIELGRAVRTTVPPEPHVDAPVAAGR